MKPKISLICAMDEKRGIGKDNGIPWHISADFKHFKEVTTGHPIVMGRATYQSIGRPLPKRTNIVVTRDENFSVDEKYEDNVEIFHSLAEAIQYAQQVDDQEIFIIGGGQIYQQTIDQADKLYLTIVEGDYQADTFFPEYDQFDKVIQDEKHTQDGINFRFLTLVKN